MPYSYFENIVTISLLRSSFSCASWSKTYEDFAKETYNRVYDDMEAALENSGGKPIFVVSGEMHNDDEFDVEAYKKIPDELENPAFAATVTHLAIIQAATDLVGKEGVVVSDESNVSRLEELKAVIEKYKGRNYFLGRPGDNAARFAIENGLKVFSDDPLRDLGADDPRRYDAEIEALQKHALAENPAKIVIHPVGAAHIGILQGVPLHKLCEDGRELTRDPEANPFEGMYAQTLFYNSLQNTPYILWEYSDQDIAYAMNPANAKQIDPPGAILESEKYLIPDYIKEASAERMALEVAANNEAAPKVENEQTAALLADTLFKP